MSVDEIGSGADPDEADQAPACCSSGQALVDVDDAPRRLAPTVIVPQIQCEVCGVSLKDVERAECVAFG